MNACERFLKDYSLSKPTLPGQTLQWLTQLRESALQSFAAQALPDSKNENWKYTQLTALEETDYRLARQQELPDLTPLAEQIKQCAAAEHYLVFINGCYLAGLSSHSKLPEGIVLSSFAQALQTHPQLIAEALGKVANYQNHTFSALNTALFSDGVFLWASENSRIERPIHCLFISSASEQPVVSHPRLLAVLKKNARLTLIEHYLDADQLNTEHAETKRANQNLLNCVTEISLDAQSCMHHYKLQYESDKSTHIAAMYVRQQAASTFISHSYSLGAALARNDIEILLAEQDAECSLNGAYLVDDSQHVDYHTQITHLSPACSSQQIYKGVVQGHARAVFNGAVIIDPAAQQSNARQLNKNLLLGDKGEVDTKPELQIYADDVICTHGATVGQLDKQALFYLQSRGFSTQDAQAWLVYGFISELLERIDNPVLRKFIEQPVLKHLEQLVGGSSNLQDLFPTGNGEK